MIFIITCISGIIIIWLTVSYAWYWGITAVLLLAMFASYWHQAQFAIIWQWLQQQTEPKAPVSGSYGKLLTAFSKIRSRILLRLGNSNRLLARIRRTANDLPIAVIILGHAHRIEWANRSASKLLAIYWPKDANVPLHHLCRDPQLRRALEQKTEESIIQISATANRNTSIRLHILAHKNMTLVLGSDITESLRTRRMRRDFVANASHELRTPLTVMSSITETMEADKQELPGKFQKPAELMRKKVQSMIKLVEDMLSLSTLEAEYPKQEKQKEIDITKLCKQIQTDLQEKIQEKQIKLQINTETQNKLIGNTEELYSLLNNLVENAITYNNNKTQITITWTKEAQTKEGHLIVQDNGIGIEAQHLPHLSERFYRVAEQRQKTGTGLGLSIVKHILQRHDGKLDIQSKPNQGTTFTCIFPRNRLEANQ